MLDHVSLGVSEIGRSRRFYDAALRPLGLVRIVDFGNGRGSDYGAAPGSLGVEFTITREPELITAVAGAHLCFCAPDRAAVRAFHAAALAGLRPQYHADYYGAFVRDPEGHRIEAVCHARRWSSPSGERHPGYSAATPPSARSMRRGEFPYGPHRNRARRQHDVVNRLRRRLASD